MLQHVKKCIDEKDCSKVEEGGQHNSMGGGGPALVTQHGQVCRPEGNPRPTSPISQLPLRHPDPQHSVGILPIRRTIIKMQRVEILLRDFHFVSKKKKNPLRGEDFLDSHNSFVQLALEESQAVAET